MRLTVIGGSGGIPGRGIPCSGYLVEFDGYSMLIDPGYGVATALSGNDFSAFDAVLVSHAHPDHCADLNPILRTRAWAEDPVAPLAVYALPGALDAVLALDRAEVVAGAFSLSPLESGAEVTIGPFRLQTSLLPHPRPNLGFRIDDGRRTLVYTGDCGPSDDVIRLARGADVLLAEASFATDVPSELHGSLSSAADVGREATLADVRRLVLTHLMPTTSSTDAIAGAAAFYSRAVSVARPGLVLDV